MNVSFISCVKEKRKGKYKAKDLYISDFFKKSLKYCLNTHDKVYILSAKYGLLDLEDMIEDYDMTLNDFSKSQRIEWSDKVYEQVQPRIDDNDTLYFYVGQNYREFLLPLLKNTFHIPLEGLGIGQQLKFFKENTKIEHRFF
jgi:cytoplasmic iron level regulating protein YaaA (DUF328/UPF0246 family)